MSRREKLLKRFLGRPADFGFDEMSRLLEGFGYEKMRMGKSAGSRAAFVRRADRHIIRLHRPHPGSIMKTYQLELVEEALRAKGLIK